LSETGSLTLFDGEYLVTSDRSSGRGQQAVIATTAAANKAAVILMGTVMAVYVGRKGTAFAAGLVTAVYFFGLMVFSPVWGGIADVTGQSRRVLVVTGGLAALAVLPLTLVAGVWLPLGFRFLFAVFAAGFLPVMLTVVGQQSDEGGRGRAIGLFNSAAAIGFMVAQFAAGALIEALPRSLVYLLLTGIASIVAIAAAFVDEPRDHAADSISIAEIGSEIRSRLVPTTSSAHLRQNGLRWLYVASFLRNMTILGFVTLLPVYFIQDVGVTPTVMGILLGVNPAIQIGGMYALGRLADVVGRKPLIVAGYAGSGLYAAILATATIPESVFFRAVIAGIGMSVLGAAFSAVQTGVISFIGDVAPPDRESELIGLRWTARGLGGVVAPPLFGAAVVVIGFEATFVGASVLAWTAAFLVAVKVTESYGTPSLLPWLNRGS
jgi:MFS family permease